MKLGERVAMSRVVPSLRHRTPNSNVLAGGGTTLFGPLVRSSSNRRLVLLMATAIHSLVIHEGDPFQTASQVKGGHQLVLTILYEPFFCPTTGQRPRNCS